MSGYCACSCRDCFEIAISDGEGPALCWECKEAGCSDGEDSECCVIRFDEEEWQ